MFSQHPISVCLVTSGLFFHLIPSVWNTTFKFVPMHKGKLISSICSMKTLSWASSEVHAAAPTIFQLEFIRELGLLTVVNKILQAHQENGLYCFCWSLRSEAVSQETRQILKHQVVRCPWIKSRAKMTGGEVLLVQSTSSRISMWSRSKGNSKTDWCLCAVFSSSSENFSFEKQAQTVLRHFWLVGHLVIAFIRAPR